MKGVGVHHTYYISVTMLNVYHKNLKIKMRLNGSILHFVFVGIFIVI